MAVMLGRDCIGADERAEDAQLPRGQREAEGEQRRRALRPARASDCGGRGDRRKRLPRDLEQIDHKNPRDEIKDVEDELDAKDWARL